MTATTEQTSRVGERVELARYTVSTGERIIYGQRVNGVVRVTDVSLARGGRAYLIERGLEQEGAHAYAALQALVADYLQQAIALDTVDGCDRARLAGLTIRCTPATASACGTVRKRVSCCAGFCAVSVDLP